MVHDRGRDFLLRPSLETAPLFLGSPETDHQRLKSNERSCISSCFLVALSSLRQIVYFSVCVTTSTHNSRTSSLSLCTKPMKDRRVISRINSNSHSSLFLYDWTHWSVWVPYRDERCSYMYCIVHVQVPRRKQPRLLISSRADDCGMANKNGNAKVEGGGALLME